MLTKEANTDVHYFSKLVTSKAHVALALIMFVVMSYRKDVHLFFVCCLFKL